MKQMEFFTEYVGTDYQVYIDKNEETNQDGRFCLIDMKTHEIIKRANKPEKLDKFVYDM